MREGFKGSPCACGTDKLESSAFSGQDNLCFVTLMKQILELDYPNDLQTVTTMHSLKVCPMQTSATIS